MIYQKKIECKYSYDIVVCGGGYAGFAAAYAAAREGKKVLLVEKGSCLGGVGTDGLVNHILGVRYIDHNDEITTCVAGIFKMLEEELIQRGGALPLDRDSLSLTPHGWGKGLGTGLIYDKEYMKLLLEEKLTEVGVKILYQTDIIDVVLEHDEIRAVVVHNKSGLFSIEGTNFIDATGDGDVCFLSGCSMEKGDEEGGMAAASLELHLENVDLEELTDYMRRTRDIRFRTIINELKEKGEWDYPYDIFISVLLTQTDVFMINTIRQVGVDGTDGQSISDAILDGRKENFKLLETARKYFPGFRNAKIRQIAPVLGIRETRRLKGRYMLSVEDLLNGVIFDDTIALSAYGWDMPHPKKPSYQPFHENGLTKKLPYTMIPYRSLLPVEISNLIAAGRCISVEREVSGSVRVMGPCIAIGEAAGIAATLAMESKVGFKDVNVRQLKEQIQTYGGIHEISQVEVVEG